jgi:beta-galactosidase/beta-glucuronidase
MRNTIIAKANGSNIRIVLIALITGILFCRCQSNIKHENLPAVEDQKSIRINRVLSENWRFQLDVRDIGEKEGWFKDDFHRDNWAEVAVPQAWDCYEDALWQYQGIAWYSTVIDPDDFVAGKKMEIIFGRVMYYSKVWLNGEFIGENIGGYLPFKFDVSKHLKSGQDNKLVIRVDNRARIEWLPASEQIEWLQYGGILESVKLVSKAHTYIDDLKIVTIPDDGSARIHCKARISNETAEELDMELTISVFKESVIQEKSAKVKCKPDENQIVEIEFKLEHAELWSPDSPVLYTASANLIMKGRVIDDLSDRFGIRQVRVEGTSILLNGEPILIKGTHRYDAYDRYGPTPPEELVREELELMKSVGINLIRVHYPASPDFLDLLDEYGFLMKEELPLNWWGLKWGEIQSIGGKAEQSLDILPQARSILTNMISRDKNHPCIIIWSMANECATNNEVGTTAMRELLKLAKSLDPTRLVTFVAMGDPKTNPGFDEADIVCFNEYFICNHIDQIDSVVYRQLTRNLASYREYFGDKPIVMSEFGRQGVKGIHGDVFYSEEWQAAYIESVWKALSGNPTISGGILWTWADYFHEAHFALHGSYGFYGIINANYGPFGVVTGDRKQKKSLETLARIYDGSIPSN